MAITYTTAYRNTVGDSGANTVFNSGKVQIWSGAAPGAGAVPTGTKLWEITLSATAFGAASSGAKAKIGTWSSTGLATGTLGYLRIITSTDTGVLSQTEVRIEGSITATAGGGDWTFDNTSLTSGQTLTINTTTLTFG